MKKIIISALSVALLSAGLFFCLIFFSDHLPDIDKKVAIIDDRPESMKRVDAYLAEYYGSELPKWKQIKN